MKPTAGIYVSVETIGRSPLEVQSGIMRHDANFSRDLCNTVYRCLRHNVNTVVSSHSVNNVHFWNVLNYISGHILQFAPLHTSVTEMFGT